MLLIYTIRVGGRGLHCNC